MYHRHSESAPQQAPNLLPPVLQPRGVQFLFGTWSGRLILVNILVFIAEVFQSSNASINSIPYETLIRMGAKESVLLASGEYWRFITPMFLHGNLLHLLFNNWALFAVAYQVEALLGARKFLILYFLAGIAGNILSALWTLNLSVGASGSLFGLLGCAWFFERTIHQRVTEATGFKPKTGAFTVMVVANILFGFIIPQIDNAAHIGGLLVGIVCAYVILRATPNRLVVMQIMRARAAAALSAVIFVVLAVIGSSPAYVKWRMLRAADLAEAPAERYFLLSRYLRLDGGDKAVVWQHFRLALKLKDFTSADSDFKLLSSEADFPLRARQLEADLPAQDGEAALWLSSRLSSIAE